MLNVYISSDIEGINGVVYPCQTEKSGEDSYISAQKQIHAELNCIIEALLELNVSQITLNDSHNSMDNILLSKIDPRINLITGKPKPISMLSCLDNTYSCVIFAGYHAKAGSLNSVLPHTFSTIYNKVSLNGNPVGEIELNAIYAGLVNVPVALVTGDNITCAEAVSLLGNIKTVCTKIAVSTTSAKCKPNDVLFKELKSAVADIVNNPVNWGICKKNPPYILELDFVDRKKADIAEFLPDLKRIDATKISYSSNKFDEVYKLLQFLTATLA